MTLTAPDGTIAAQESGGREPGTYEVAFPPLPPPPPPPPEGQPPLVPTESLPPAEGRWALTVTSTDDQGLSSTATRRFAVNTTLGFLKVEPARLVLPKNGGRTVTIRWTQARAAKVKVTVETGERILVRSIANQRFEAGAQAVTWDGRANWGKLVFGGSYVIRVTATNELGVVSLEQHLTVRRTA
jgi:hypothetical protein